MNQTYKCTIRLLDDTEVVQCDFSLQHKGHYLLEYVCKQLNLIEKDYFGLRYVDARKQRHWLDLMRSVIKQVKEMNPIIFCFRVKFYPPDPFRLKEEVTRYQIFLQLRRDLLHGRLYCSQSDAALLAAYVIQAELGDYNPALHSGNYISEMKLLLKQSPKIEEKILEVHQTQLKGQTPGIAEMNFLRKACLMDTYGVDPHPVKDHRGNQLYLGINHAGILTFQGSRKTHHFRWNDVQKINYEGKMFIVHLVFNEKKHTVGFKCPTGAACKHLWRCAVEQRLFFTLNSSSEAPSIVTGGSIFSWGSKFKYSGRVEKELLEDAASRSDEPLVSRTPLKPSGGGGLPRKSQSVPATPSTPVSDGYDSLPRSNHSVPLPETSNYDEDILYGIDIPLNSPYCPESTLPLLEPLMEDPERSGLSRSRAGTTAAEEARMSMNESEAESSMEMEWHGGGTGARLRQRHGGVMMRRAMMMPTRTMTVGGDEMSRPDGDSRESRAKLFDRAESIPPEVEADVTEEGASGYDPSLGPPQRSPYYDYYGQDYYKHSSSESQLDASGSHYGLSRATQTPVHGSSSRPGGAATTPTASQPPKRFNVLRVFIPALAFVVLSLSCLVVVVLESESDLLSAVRRLPEMVALRRDYYEPVKEFLRDKMAGIL